MNAGDRTLLRVSAQSPSSDELAREVRSDACGAVVTFAGVVRDRTGDGRAVVALEYEIYEEPALRELALIVEEARARFGECNVAVTQRTGLLPVGEISVAIAVAAPHRAAAFDACEYLIDELKRRVPIWKKERYADGTTAWIENLEARA
jgi:molybdopterin synthase catalytic subunit